MANMKFKLTNETKVLFGKTLSFSSITLFRIEATASFGNVEKGEKGGWIEKEDNLSQYGNAWVYGNARVSGDARVSGNAEVSGSAEVSGNAWVYGNAWVSGDARVYGDAKLSLKKAFTKGSFLHSSDSTITPTIIDQSKEEVFNSSKDYKYLLVVGDYEIGDIDLKPTTSGESIEIEGKKYTLTEIKEALSKQQGDMSKLTDWL